MRVGIIRNDNVVIVDGKGANVDLSGLPPEIHAIQWYGLAGEIEYAPTFTDAGLAKKPNKVIMDFEPYQAYADEALSLIATAEAMQAEWERQQLANAAAKQALIAAQQAADEAADEAEAQSAS